MPTIRPNMGVSSTRTYNQRHEPSLTGFKPGPIKPADVLRQNAGHIGEGGNALRLFLTEIPEQRQVIEQRSGLGDEGIARSMLIFNMGPLVNMHT